MAKRHWCVKFAVQSARLNPQQRNLLVGETDADVAAVAQEIEQFSKPPPAPRDRTQAKLASQTLARMAWVRTSIA
jgi:hypothetical protein